MKADEIKRVAVAGAGVMGHSIAQVFAQAGMEVQLVDLDGKILDRAMRLVKSNLGTLAEHGRVEASEIPAILERIHTGTDIAAGALDADFILEAVVENSDVKKEVFALLDKSCSQSCILASNTSSLDIFNIVEVSRPERLIVAHWFSPPHIIPLVEVVCGAETSPEVLDTTVDLMRRLGKRPVIMKQFVRSFIVNRIQTAVATIVLDMLDKGTASPEDIDLAIKTSLGIRLPIVGVAQTLDFTGLKLVADINRGYGMEPPAIIDKKVKNGNLGVSTSKGLYDYGGRTEEEILKKRDMLYIKMLDYLESIKAFEPV